MKGKGVLFLILGIIAALIDIGCSLTVMVAISWPEKSDYLAVAVACVLWGGGALLAFTGAAVLFVKAFGGRRLDDFMRIIAFIYGVILAGGGVWVLYRWSMNI